MTLPADLLERPKGEAWRWFDFDAVKAAAVMPRVPVSRDADVFCLGLGGPCLLFIDGAFVADRSNPGPVVLGDDGGWTLTVPVDAVPEPIQIVHISTGTRNHLPARIALAEDAAAAVVETYAGPGGWTNRATQVTLGRAARLTHAVRVLQQDGFVWLNHEAQVGEGASLVSVVLAAGDAGCRIDGRAELTGEGAYAELSGALLTRGETQKEAALVMRHAVPMGTSRQVWRAVAADASQASLAARAEVARDAQKTDGEQSLRGLLLQRTATVNLKPELEIFADDVKCAHGATVGELDRNALFYLTSRGIPPEEARAMLTRTFVADAIDRIGHEEVRDAFYADVDRWFASSPLPSGEEGARAAGVGR